MKKFLYIIEFLCIYSTLLIFGTSQSVQAEETYHHPFPPGQNWLSDPGLFVEDSSNWDWDGDGDYDSDKYGGEPDDGILELPLGIHYFGDGVGANIPAGCTLIVQPGTTFVFANGTSLSVNGTLDAKGTPDEPIVFEAADPVKKDFSRIVFDCNKTNKSVLEYCEIRNAKPFAYGMVQIIGSNDPSVTTSSPVFRHCTFSNSEDVAMKIMYNSDPVIEDCAFEGNKGYAIAISNCLKKGFAFPGCTVSGNGVDGIQLTSYQGAVYTPDDIIVGADIPLYVDVALTVSGKSFTVDDNARLFLNSNLTIAEDAQLILEPGACIYAGKDIYITAYGKVTAVGTADNHITITSSQTTKAPGDWQGMQISRSSADGSVLKYCDISYGGRSGFYANLRLGDSYAPVPLTDILIEDCTFSYSAYDGLNLNSGSDATVTNCTFTGNGSVAISHWRDCFGGTFTGCSASKNGANNDGNFIWYDSNGSINPTSDMTFSKNGNMFYYFGGSFTISKGITVTVEDGADIRAGSANLYIYGGKLAMDAGSTLRMGKGTEISVRDGGAIVAKGTKTKKVLITSAETKPTAGDWDGICFHSTASKSALSYTTVEYGGNGYISNIRLGWDYIPTPNNIVTIKNCEIRYSSNGGIWLGHGSKITISDCNIHDNKQYGIVVDADPQPTLTNCTILKNGLFDIVNNGASKLDVTTVTYKTVDKADSVKKSTAKGQTVSKGAPTTPVLTKNPVKGDKAIKGTAAASSTVTLKINSKTKGAVKTDSKGAFSFTVAALKSGDKLELVCSLKSKNSPALKFTVK